MKILSFTILFLIFFIQKPIFSNSKSNPNSAIDLSLIGWKPSETFSEENKANFKTIDALKKLKKIRRLRPYFKDAFGYALFPNVAKAGFGIGGSRGKGEVFQEDKVIGSTTLTQLTVGFQLGAQAFTQIIFFQNKSDLDRFTAGNYEFGASASAVLITEGANASVDYRDGVAVMTFLFLLQNMKVLET